MKVVPREAKKNEGLEAPKVFGLGTSRGTTFTMLPQRLFQRIVFFMIPKLVNWTLFQPM